MLGADPGNRKCALDGVLTLDGQVNLLDSQADSCAKETATRATQASKASEIYDECELLPGKAEQARVWRCIWQLARRLNMTVCFLLLKLSYRVGNSAG